MKGNQPAYKSASGGHLAWLNKDKNDKEYLTVKNVDANIYINLFPNVPKSSEPDAKVCDCGQRVTFEDNFCPKCEKQLRQ